MSQLTLEQLEALLEACEMGEVTVPGDFDFERVECEGGVETNFLDQIGQ